LTAALAAEQRLMRIVDRSVYVGPSLYARFPVIRLELDLGALEAWPTGRLGRAFVDALASALPGLSEHGCSYREPGGFFRRMREDDGTWLGHVLEHVAIELQNMAGEEVTFGKTRAAGAPGVYTVVYEYAQRDEGIAAGELGLKLLCSLLPVDIRPAESVPGDWSWAEARDEFIRFAQRRALGPSTSALVRAAERHDIPWLRLNDQSLVQLGHGKYQQRIQATVTSRTSHIAVELASDKEETNKILATLGLPVPKQELVQSEKLRAIGTLARFRDARAIDALTEALLDQNDGSPGAALAPKRFASALAGEEMPVIDGERALLNDRPLVDTRLQPPDAAGAAAACVASGVRVGVRACSGPVRLGPGGPEPAGRERHRAPAGLPDR